MRKEHEYIIIQQFFLNGVAFNLLRISSNKYSFSLPFRQHHRFSVLVINSGTCCPVLTDISVHFQLWTLMSVCSWLCMRAFSPQGYEPRGTYIGVRLSSLSVLQQNTGPGKTLSSLPLQLSKRSAESFSAMNESTQEECTDGGIDFL